MGMILVMTAEPATAAAANLSCAPGTVERATDRFADGLDLDDVLLDDGVRRKRLDRIVFDAVTAADLPQLQQLDRSRADIDADQRRRFRCEQAHTFSPSHALLRAKDAPLH